MEVQTKQKFASVTRGNLLIEKKSESRHFIEIHITVLVITSKDDIHNDIMIINYSWQLLVNILLQTLLSVFTAWAVLLSQL